MDSLVSPPNRQMNTNKTLANSFTHEATHLLNQSIVKIEHCLSQLSEAQVWWRPDETANSIGNLILHLAGNLRQWTVCGIKQKPDERDRELEFSKRDGLSKSELLQKVKATIAEAVETIESQTAESLLRPLQIQGFTVNTMEAISHSSTHFVGHTHQIIYITRLQLGQDYQFQWTPDSDRGVVPI